MGQNGLVGAGSDLAPDNPPAGYVRTNKQWYINCAGNIGGSMTLTLANLAAGTEIPSDANINQYALLYRENAEQNFSAVMHPTSPVNGIFQFNNIIFKDGFYALGYATEEFPVTGWNAIPESSFTKLVLAPNPVNDMLNIQGVPMNTQIKIFNLTGNVLYQENLHSNQNTISLSELNPGFYFIELQTGKEKIIKKIIKNQ